MSTSTAERRPQIEDAAAAKVHAAKPDTTTVAQPPTIAPERASRPDRHGHRTVSVRCPYCGRRHVHGMPSDGGPVGHRLSHCDRDVEHLGYVIVGASA